MKVLWLLRHGEALAATPSGEDRSRPLSQQGLAQAHAAGLALARSGRAPGLALVSDALRAKMTAEELIRAMGTVSPAVPAARLTPKLYRATPEGILDLLQLLDAEGDGGGESLLVVAHNPALEDLASRLSGRLRSLGAGALCMFRYECATWAEVARGVSPAECAFPR